MVSKLQLCVCVDLYTYLWKKSTLSTLVEDQNKKI